MSREEKLVKNTGILAIGIFFPKLAIFVALPILTALLSKAEYGVYDLTITMVSLVLPVATLQIQSAAFRFLLDVRDNVNEKKKIITNIYVFVFAVSFIALIVTFLILTLLRQPIMIRFGICFYYLFDIIANVNRQIIRGLLKNVDYAISSIISGVGQLLLIGIMVVRLKTGLIGCLVALSVAELFSMMYLFLHGKIFNYIDVKELDKSIVSEMLSYSWPMVPNSLSQWVIHASDRIVITSFLGVEANAVYSVAYKIPSILSLAQTTFNMSWQESASIALDDSDAGEYYSKMFTWLLNCVAGMMAVLIGLTPLLFKLFVRGDYSAAYNQIPILFMGIFLLCLSTFWGGIFVAAKQTKAVGTTTVIAAIINVSFNLLAVRSIGLYAGSISSFLAYFIMCILRAIRIQKIIKIKYNYFQICVVGSIFILQCFVCFKKSFYLNSINLAIGFVTCIILNRKLIRAILFKLRIMK